MDNTEMMEMLARLEDAEHPLTDAELARVAEAITAIAADIDVSNPTDDDIAVLTEARTQLQTVRAQQAERTEAAATRAQAAADLLADITPATEEADVEEVAAEVPDVDVVAEAEQVVEDAPQPVAASAELVAPTLEPQPEYRRPTISRLAHRRPPERKPIVAATETVSNRAVLTASADIPGLAAGAEVDPERWAEGVRRKFESFRGAAAGRDGEKIYLGNIRRQWPSERFLDDNETANEDKIRAVVSPEALAASGGICGPVGVDYSLSTIAQAARPVRDGMAQFGASRGGLRYILPHTLAQVTTDGPAGVWTAANDVSLNSPSTKVQAVFACQGVVENTVDAVTSVVRFGNFQSRYFPEQIAQYMETVDAVHARLAEATLLAAMSSGSTAVNAGSYSVGAARELLSIIDRSASAYRYRHRMAPEARLRVVYPEWLEDMFREDLAKNLPGDSGGRSERLAVADAEIDNWFNVRGINVTNTQDSPTGAAQLQGWGIQGAGQLLPWPSSVVIWLFHEGAWMFLDGGQMDLGMIRDATLARTNDYLMFSETFEKGVLRGHESLAITCNIAPTGATIGTEAPTSVTPTRGS